MTPNEESLHHKWGNRTLRYSTVQDGSLHDFPRHLIGFEIQQAYSFQIDYLKNPNNSIIKIR